MNRLILRYAIIVGLILGVIYVLSRSASSLTLLEYWLVVLLIAVPVWLTLAHVSAVRRAHATTLLLAPVWWDVVIAPGHLLRMFFALVPALLAGTQVASMIVITGPVTVAWLAATAAVFALLVQTLLPFSTARLRPYAKYRPVIWLGSAATGIVLGTAWVAMTPLQVSPTNVDALFAAKGSYTGSSALLAVWHEWLLFVSGGQGLVADWLTAVGLPDILPALWRFFTSANYFAGTALACAAVMLPGSELRRILEPSDFMPPARLSTGKTVVAGFFVTILLVVATQGLAVAEARYALLLPPVLTDGTAAAELSDTSAMAEDAIGVDQPRIVGEAPQSAPPPLPFSPQALRDRITVEAMGGLRCPLGTKAALEGLDADFKALLDSQRADIARTATAGFDGMRSNVPTFLDWYYSLSAEYLRTANLLIGSGEEYLLGQLKSHLERGSPFGAVDTALAYMVANPVLNDAYLLARAREIEACEDSLLPSDSTNFVIALTAGDALRGPVLHLDSAMYNARLSAAGLLGAPAGVVAGVIIVKIGSKVIAGTVFKMAAGALIKIAGSKALTLGGGILVGAGTGGAGGSVVPGIGMTAGAVVGGIVGGIAAMVGVDYGLLKLDEAVSREEFSIEIIGAINESEAEFLALVDPSGAP